jgi:RHH-type proline utilization regulon transcriptional repressor/proline dehydrogenase/delta 1-pyrroline-5-carboxylate dehydrogenase
VDAHYKRLLDVVLRPENAGAMRVGAASHNLFELSWALTVAEHRGVPGMLELEMLEGMAPAMAAAVRDRVGDLLLYTPIVRRRDTESSIAYLVRRFEENAGPDNFLRNQFALTPSGRLWEAEVQRFRRSVSDHRRPATPSRRRHRVAGTDYPFRNEPGADLALGSQRAWASGLMLPLHHLGIEVVPAVVGGETVSDLPLVDGFDPSSPGEVPYRWCDCTEEIVDRALRTAGPAGEIWRSEPPQKRASLLRAVGHELAQARGRLIGVMGRDAGKVFSEADAEVSEAVDFARFYGGEVAAIDDRSLRGSRFDPYPTVLVVPPWNFPLAIPAGGVTAALAAGASVILKPAPETVATAYALAEACWKAGVPRDILQFVPCSDGAASRKLVCSEEIHGVILTGSWDTARMFRTWRPGIRLHAETSGKNAMLVTSSADLELAVVDLVRSAFSHSGQKCSAASLAILERCVYEDERFMRQLADSVRSLRPGPAWDLHTTLGPVIRPPSGPLLDALTRLQPGESWLVAPRRIHDNLWTPGVKLGVRPGSSFHMTECFGPVLGLMCADDLDEAIRWQNMVPYGLTAGLSALDPAEIELWRDRVHAGNLYVNRHTTGAVVGRQPFGGWKKSVVGPAAKAGGHHYVPSLGRWSAETTLAPLQMALAVGEVLHRDLAPADTAGLRSEANTLRHVPLESVLLRVGAGTSDAEIASAAEISRTLQIALEVSRDTIETEDELVRRLATSKWDKVRVWGAASEPVRIAVLDSGSWLDEEPLSSDPTAESLRWVREQSVSETRHRHGDITSRRPGLTG